MVTTFERSWPDVLIGPISVFNHTITLPHVDGLHTKQKVTLQLGSLSQEFEIKRILSPTTIKVGPVNSNIYHYSNPVAFNGGILWAGEQSRNTIAVDPIIRNVYEEEPAVAIRSVGVDRYGRFYSEKNPLPVRLSDGDINIGTVNAELEVQLSHLDNYPDPGDVHDSVRIGGRNNGPEVSVNADGSLNILTLDAISGMEQRVDHQENITYIGVAESGSSTSDPVWRIIRKVKFYNNLTSSEDEIVESANGGEYNNVWDDRGTLFSPITPIVFFNRRFEKLLVLLTNANWMALGDFDRVSPSFFSDRIEMDYFQENVKIGTAIVKYLHEKDWRIDLLRYINDDSGDMLLDDDGEYLFLD